MIDIELKKRGVYLGKTGETGRYRVWMDVSAWAEEYSGGTGILLFTDPKGNVKPMRTTVEFDGEKTKLYGLVTEEETKESGTGVIEARWESAGVVAKSDHFNAVVMESTYTGQNVGDNTPDWVRDLITELSVVDQVIDGVRDMVELADDVRAIMDGAENTATEAAGNAEAWAVGQRGGEDVESTDAAYENNSKYYAEEAAEAAETAGTAAESASGSATAAAGSAAAAAGSAQAAQTAAEQVTAERVDAWLAEHISQETGYVLDDALVETNAAAQAKAVGDKISDLKSAIGIPAEEKTAMFEQGTLDSSTGQPDSRSDRIRTKDYIPTDGVTEIGITDTSTYFFTILWYDAEENYLSSTGWVSGASYEGTTGSFFRVVIGKNDSISPSANTGFYYMAVPSVSEVLEALEDSIGGEIDRIDRMINIPDEEKTAIFEQGTIDGTTDQPDSRSDRIRTKDYIPCDGVTEIGVGDRTTYFFSILWYDAEENFLSSTSWVSGATYEGTTGSFFRVVIGKNGGTISLSDDTGFHYVVTPTVSEALETLEDAVSATNDAVEALADIVAMPEQTIAPRLEQGTIDGGTGQDSSNTKRLRTVGYISAEGVTEIGTTNFAGYGYTILWYDENNGFIRATGWHQAAYDREIQGAYFRVVMAKRPDGVMSPTEDTGLYYKVSGKAINTVVEANTAKIENLAADDRVSINIIKQKWSPDDMQSGCCFVGNDLWQFCPGADDGSSTANVYVVAYDFEANTLTHVKTMTHNLGHVNSVAYCAETDTLVCGNGSGDYTLFGKIFIVEDLSQRTELNRNDCIVIDVGMDFGYKVNAVWGESNAGRNDIVYLCTNDSHSIYRLQLGKGNNNLGSGTLISGTEGFNGTYKVTHSWQWGTTDAAGHDYANCVQGMVFWKNRLVWGYGHNNGLSMRAATLYAGGKMKIDGANYETLTASGALAAKYMCGMTKFGPYGEYLGICASQTLWVVKDWD